MVKVGVCLSGCGVFDGSEIHEAVITLLALDREGAKVLCMAPNVEQMHVIDHLTGEPTEEKRNVLTESARIARGKIRDVAQVTADEIDALIFPGGYGAAKNLCDFAVSGDRAQAQPDVVRLLREMLAARKPIGAICIAPAMVAASLKGSGVESSLTLGDEGEASGKLERMGAKHLPCPVEEFRVDEQNRIVSTPAYMLPVSIAEAAKGIERLVGEVLRMAREPVDSGA